MARRRSGRARLAAQAIAPADRDQRVYLQDDRFDEARAAIDRENVYHWRHAPRRLEAEPIRDAMLAIAGLLDERMYGPGSLDPAMRRRSVYFFIKRSQLIPMMMLFDWPEHLVSIGQRSDDDDRAAGPDVHEQPARPPVRRGLGRGSPGRPAGDAIRHGYRIACGREPTDAEIRLSACSSPPEQGLRAGRQARPRRPGPGRLLPGPDEHERIYLYSLILMTRLLDERHGENPLPMANSARG